MKKEINYTNHLFNFIAVILGVYLAFYMNDSSKKYQDKKESILLMQSLATELREDIETYKNYQIPENKSHQQSLNKLITALTEKNNDKVNEYLSAIFKVENYTPTTSTYSSIKASGKFRLIESFELRKRISDFYEGQAIEGTKKGEFQIEYFKTELIPWVTTHMNLSEMTFLNNTENIILKNKLIIYESLLAQKVESYKTIVKESEELKTKIDSILSHK